MPESFQTIAPEESCSPVRVRAGVKVNRRNRRQVGGRLGAVFLGGNCRRTVPESLYATFFKETLTRVFSCEFCEIKDNFFIEHLRSFWFTIIQLQEA